MSQFNQHQLKHTISGIVAWSVYPIVLVIVLSLTSMSGAIADQASDMLPDSKIDSLPVQLLQPKLKTKVATTTPTFAWRALRSDSLVEYRLLVAEPDGKILIDRWVGSDTSYSVPLDAPLDDLTFYHWLVQAQQGNSSVKSPVWSFWIDKDVVTDLKIDRAIIVNDTRRFRPGDAVEIQVQIQNCGPEKIDQCFLTLFSGNTNRNYFDYSALRKTVPLDTLEVKSLDLNEPQTFTLQGKIPQGLNPITIRLDPGFGFSEIYWPDNFYQVEKIQTIEELIRLRGLFLFYKNYEDAEGNRLNFKDDDLKIISQNIARFKEYFWDHTRLLRLEVDTVHVNRVLKLENFLYQNDAWGYVFPPTEAAKDLKRRNIDPDKYDYVFAYYSWRNSRKTWTGYGGYTYGGYKLSNDLFYFLAQPTLPGQVDNEFITIHEFIHLLDHIFERNGAKEFYSPHHKSLFTTFTQEIDYFDWILETWPAEKWLLLSAGRRISGRREQSAIRLEALSEPLASIALLQNYPNPFNLSTTFTIVIPALDVYSNGANVKLTIYDLQGNYVLSFRETYPAPGAYQISWNGRDSMNRPVATGVYLYELRSQEERQIKKLLIIH